MRVLVCGGRDYKDTKRVNEVLDALHAEHPITVIIHGAAKGADSRADMWAWENGIPAREFPADWKTYGPSAGPRRNAQMLAQGQPELVVAFPGGRGTHNMVMQARLKGVRVMEVK